MRLIFWDKKAETYHREDNVSQCTVTHTIVNGHVRRCYVLYYNDSIYDRYLLRTNYELERIEM